MTLFKRIENGFSVQKSNVEVAIIHRAQPAESSEWGDWILEHKSGRIDRHHNLEDAKSDAAKI